MTITETRPETVEAAAAEPVVASGNIFTSADHKNTGRLFLVVGAVALVAAATTTLLFQLPAFGDGADIWTRPGSRLAAASGVLVFVVALPALWLGLMTYVVPLQLGATRLSVPRLHTVGFWSFAGGAVLAAIALSINESVGPVLGAIIPFAAQEGAQANEATELLIGALALLALGTTLVAGSILVTAAVQRPRGMTLARLPVFSWTAVATTLVLVISTPVFVSGIAILFADQHWGAAFFSSESRFAPRVWQHHLWLFGRPEALLFAAAAVGALADAVAVHAGRPLFPFPVARAAAVATTLFTLLLWATPFSALGSVLLPTPTIASALVAVPAGLAVLSWLATLASGKPRLHPSLISAFGFVALLLGAAAMAAVAGFTDVEDVESFRNAQITLVGLGASLMGLAGALQHWAPKLGGRLVPLPAGLLQTSLLLAGVVVLAAPGYAVGLGANADIAVVGAAGSALLALGIITIAPIFLPARSSLPPDPYGTGLTLEWVAESPPAPGNFDRVPTVESAHPLQPRTAGDAG